MGSGIQRCHMASQLLPSVKNDNFSDRLLIEVIFCDFFYLRHPVVLYIIKMDIITVSTTSTFYIFNLVTCFDSRVSSSGQYGKIYRGIFCTVVLKILN